MSFYRRQFEIFADKGPINHGGSQTKANKAFNEVEALITNREYEALMEAKDTAFIGDGREDWDRLMAQIRKRLWPDG